MAALGKLLGRFKASKPDAEAVARIKTWTRECLHLPEEAALAVNEIICNDPACPGMETVVLVMEPGRKTLAYKVGKNLEDVVKGDIANAILPQQQAAD